MGIEELVAADGRRWTVRRRLQWPRWREFGRNVGEDDLLWFGFTAGESPLGVVAGFLVAIVLGLIVFILLPLVVLVLEVIVVVGAVLLLRGTWIVEARTDDPVPTTEAWRVRGLLRSKRAVEEVASQLRAGIGAAPERGEPVEQE